MFAWFDLFAIPNRTLPWANRSLKSGAGYRREML